MHSEECLFFFVFFWGGGGVELENYSAYIVCHIQINRDLYKQLLPASKRTLDK